MQACFGRAPQEQDGGPFKNKMAHLAAQPPEQQAEMQRPDTVIEGNTARPGFGANREEAG
ncbi:MAG: hypothetical protein OXH92_11280 [Bryobacterales bacterium]|nr:hypothetical protein [Bryobacterales bacterium]